MIPQRTGRIMSQVSQEHGGKRSKPGNELVNGDRSQRLPDGDIILALPSSCVFQGVAPYTIFHIYIVFKHVFPPQKTC